LHGALNEPLIRQGVKRLVLDKPDSISGVLHALRLFGPKATTYDRQLKQDVPLLDCILQSDRGAESFGGGPVLIDTREGVRCRIVVPRNAGWQRERQAHEDQLLATLAELGVPLGQVVTTTGGERNVRDILNDTLAKFNPEQREIEWSALALALYLPPQRSWRDKFGTEYSLDYLAEKLMNRLLWEGLPCGGTHGLYTLAILARVDEGSPVLSSAIRAKVQEHLRQRVSEVVRTQAPDGSWLPEWYLGRRAESVRPDAAPGSDWGRVLATGHHVEWLILLPAEWQPPRECLLRAARWLEVRLAADPNDVVVDHYCPYSHAAKVLSTLAAPVE
jgi:hypothetical protein